MSEISRRTINTGDRTLGTRKSLMALVLTTSISALAACDATPPSVSPDEAVDSLAVDSLMEDNGRLAIGENFEVAEGLSRPTQGLIPPRQLVAVLTEENGMLKREFEKLTRKDTLDAPQNQESADRLLFDSPKTSAAEELTWEDWLEMAINRPEVKRALNDAEVREEMAELRERKEEGLGEFPPTVYDVILWEFEQKRNDVVRGMETIAPERVELITNMWNTIEKHYSAMPKQEAQRKAAALEAFVPNYDAFKLLITLEIDGTGGKKLERVKPGDLQPGDEVERHNPCIDGKFGFTVEQDGDHYVDSNGKIYTQEQVESKCREYDTYYREKQGNLEPLQPRMGEGEPEEDGEEGEESGKAKLNPYLFARYRFGAMNLINGSDTQAPMQNHTAQGGLGVEIGPENPHIGYAGLTLAGGISAVPGRPNKNTDAKGGKRARAGNLTLGLEGNFHIPEQQEWMDLDFVARAELHALFGPKDLITDKTRLGGGVGLGAALKWWLGKNSRVGLTVSGGWDHLINPTDHGYRLGEFSLERPLVKSNNVYLNGGVIFRLGKKNEEN